MSKKSLVFFLVPLLQLHVLAADAYVGNSRSWSSRDFNLQRRPLYVDSTPNAMQPIHMIPRPLPKPIEIPSIPKPIIVLANTESRLEETRPTISAYTARPQRFNLQRLPIRSPQAVASPAVALSPVPVATLRAPATFAPRPIAKPAPVAPKPTNIALEPIKIAPAPVIIDEDSEDIEIVTAPSSTRSPPARHYIMPRPIPRPSRIHLPSTATIRTPTNNKPKVVPVVPIVTTPKALEIPKINVYEYSTKLIPNTQPIRPEIVRRRPVTIKPTVLPSRNTPRVTPRPAPVVTSVKPIPLVTTPKPVPTVRTVIDSSIILADYKCNQLNGYYGVSNECDSYVECQSSVAMMSSCPDGLHFDPRAIWPEYPCAYPSEVQCDGVSKIQKAQPTEECPRQYGFFPLAGSDCSQYLMCQEGLGTVMNCPPGLVFNSGKDTCDWPENVPSCSPDIFRGFSCPAPPLEEDGSISDITLNYKFNNSCKEYVACQRGHPRLLKCDPGLYFDEESQTCIDSEYVQNCTQ